MMTEKMETGAFGEQLAADFMVARGFHVRCRNYRYGKSEIDLILQRDDWLIFVEVKARSSVEYGQPEDFIDWRKSRRMLAAAENFIFSTNWRGNVRFDVISIQLTDPPEIVLLEDAIH